MKQDFDFTTFLCDIPLFFERFIQNKFQAKTEFLAYAGMNGKFQIKAEYNDCHHEQIEKIYKKLLQVIPRVENAYYIDYIELQDNQISVSYSDKIGDHNFVEPY